MEPQLNSTQSPQHGDSGEKCQMGLTMEIRDRTLDR
jgi:hypothetical protein